MRGVGSLRQEVPDGRIQRGLGRRVVGSRRIGHGDREGGRIDAEPVVPCAHPQRLPRQHQPLAEERGLGRAAQQFCQHGKGGGGLLVARVAFGHDHAAGQDGLGHARVGHGHAPLGPLLGLLRAGIAGRVAFGRDRAIVLFGQRAHLVGRDVARHDQHGHVRGVMVLVPFQRVLAGQRLHLAAPADHGAAVGVVVELDRRALLGEQRPGVAVGTLGAFLKDDLPLGLPVVLADAQVRHPVGFHAHDQVQPVRGDALEIGGEVVRGEGIVHAAVGRDRLRQLSGVQLLGALEHQVFQVMRQPGLAGHLVGRADLVPQHLDHDRRAVILDHHGLEPVAEREVADARGHLGQRRSGGGGQKEGEGAAHGRAASGLAGAGRRLVA